MQVQARHYLRDALLAGTFDKGSLTIKGPLDHFPFNKTNDGAFNIQAPFQQALVQYSPASFNPAGSRRESLNWPQVQQASGELQVNMNHLLVKSANARLGPQAQIQVGRLEVMINDFNDIVVDVNAQLKGSLSDAMQTMLATPLSDKLSPWMSPGLVLSLIHI